MITERFCPKLNSINFWSQRFDIPNLIAILGKKLCWIVNDFPFASYRRRRSSLPLKRYSCCGKSLVIFIKYFFFALFKLQQFSTRFIKEKNNCFLEKPLFEANLILPPPFSSSLIHVPCILELRLCGVVLSITFKKIYGTTYQWRKILRANEKKFSLCEKRFRTRRKCFSISKKLFSIRWK